MNATRFSCGMLAVLLAGLAAGCSSEEPAAPVASTTAEARDLLDKLAQAHRKLQSARFAGTLEHTLAQTGGEAVSDSFTSSFHAPHQFRFEIADQLLTGGTGERVYLYSIPQNEYLMADETEVGQFPPPLGDQLRDRNLALYLALADDPAEALERGAARIERLKDQTLDGKSYRVLQITGKDKSKTRLLIDPQTHLLRRVVHDLSGMEMPPGAGGQAVGQATTDYTKVETDVSFPDDHFAWSPPSNARDAALAPEFTLPTLDGEQVSLSELRGNVVVLDFWATWCGPCRRSLPDFAQLAREMKGQKARFFAVSMGEPQARAEAFVRESGLDVPVLLDETQEVAARYGVRGIPYTVVIGPDGRVREAFEGTQPEGKIRDAVEAALSE